jgi:hypothetical protein
MAEDLKNTPFVFIVSADPKPDQSLGPLFGDSAVIESNPRGPKNSHLF